MLGIIYLILAGILGYKASKILIEEGTKFSFINRIWLTLPASFGVGTAFADLGSVYHFVVFQCDWKSKKSTFIWKCYWNGRRIDIYNTDRSTEIQKPFKFDKIKYGDRSD